MKITFHIMPDEAQLMIGALEKSAVEYPSTGTALTRRVLMDLAGLLRHELARTPAAIANVRRTR